MLTTGAQQGTFSETEEVQQDRSLSKDRRMPILDFRTFLLLPILWLGLALVYEGHRRGLLHSALATFLSLFFMHFSFTIWHEGIHGTISRWRFLNNLIGRLGAIPVFIPYSRMKVHHLLHHSYTNIPEKDPDYWQLEGSFWLLPFRYLEGERRARKIFLAQNPPRSWIYTDLFQNALSFGIIIWLVSLSPLSALVGIIIPRVLLVYVDVVYINYLPHAGLPNGRFLETRLLMVPHVVRYLMLMHNYHAIHHIWPQIPWHCYHRTFLLENENLKRRGVPMINLAGAGKFLLRYGV